MKKEIKNINMEYIIFFRDNNIQFENYEISTGNCSLCKKWGEVLNYYKYDIKICTKCNYKLYKLYKLQEIIYKIRHNLAYYINSDNNLKLLDEIIYYNKYDFKKSKNKIIEFLHTLNINDDYDSLKIKEIIKNDLRRSF